ncbi:MAG TPA: hypothetical protein VFE19_10465 [Jatrophihabitantaceae bacterium]|nr:hypothetical protein [Jatrophihabitantaceae bacterium]
MDGMSRLVSNMAQQSGGPVSIIGWSLGGGYGRELARDDPEHVRQAITLGSPYLVDELALLGKAADVHGTP